MALADDTSYRAKQDVTWRETEGKLIVLNLQSGLYYTFDEMATEFFNLLIEEMKVAEIVNSICEKYEATPEQVRTDLEEFVEKLIAENLLEPGNA